MYNDFKFKNYKQTNHKIRRLRELVDRLYGDYEYKKKLINEINLKIKINLPSEANLPDLTITNITSIDKGHYFEFTITIQNIGEVATTEETNLVITILDQETELIVPALDVDETVDRYTSFPYDPAAVDTYSLNVNSEVNEERNIEESNYENNILAKDFIIKEKFVTTGLIVHAHNPEGIEIGSLENQIFNHPPAPWIFGGEVYINDVLIYPTPYNEETHNFVITTIPPISPGLKTVKVRINNIIMQKSVTFIENQVSVVYFVFPRIVTSVYRQENAPPYYNVPAYFHRLLYSGTVEDLGNAVFYLEQAIPPHEQAYSLLIEDNIYRYYPTGYPEPSQWFASTIPYDFNGTGVRG